MWTSVQLRAMVPVMMVLSWGCSSLVDGDPPEPAITTWIKIAPGSYTRGSPPSEPCRWENEDQHRVTIDHHLLVSSTEVTRGQYRDLQGSLPPFSHPLACKQDTCPTTFITWDDAVNYCNALSELNGYALCYSCTLGGGGPTCKERAGYSGAGIIKCPGYRLPTEDEWEYAYRSGTATAYYNGSNSSCTGADPALDESGWYAENANWTVHPVGLKRPNAWGLYDMAGNVWEWTHDEYLVNPSIPGAQPPKGGVHTVRGGSFANYARKARAASRDAPPPGQPLEHRGFRCVRTCDKDGV